MPRHAITLLLFAFLFLAGVQGCVELQENPVVNMPGPPDDAWFQTNVVEKPALVVVDFYADWCGPCRQLSPLLEKLEADYDGQVEVVKVDVDEREVVAAHYDVSSIPLVLVMYKGEVLGVMQGARPYSALEALVKPHLGIIQAEVADPSVLENVE